MKPILKYYLITFLIMGLAACAGNSKESQDMAARQRIAESYGLQNLHKVEQIQYTFNVKKGDKHVKRFWIWEPKTDKVTLYRSCWTD